MHVYAPTQERGQASLVGSVLCNILLVMRAAVLTGGAIREPRGASTEGGDMSTSPTSEAPPAERGRPFLLTGEGWPYLLVPLIPVAIVLRRRRWRYISARRSAR